MVDDLFRKIPEKKLTNIDEATLIIKKENRKEFSKALGKI